MKNQLMLISMTGFGRSVVEYKAKKITVDIKSLNSKSLDLSARIPSFYKEKELEIRRLISERMQRGKVELTINVETDCSEESDQLNEAIIVAYYKRLKDISQKNNIPLGEETLSGILRLPDVLKSNSEAISEEEWGCVLNTINNAINNCIDFRTEEGKILEGDIKQRILSILDLLEQVKKYESERIDTIKERIKLNIQEIGNVGYDSNRYEQEIIYYLEKLDINEEKVRLKKHCEYFLETVNVEEFAGKKLGFISQEIGREINTLGSKAHHAEIQKLVVMMKDELEKIKEQLLNVL